MVKTSNKDSKASYGFGANGIMAKEYFPFFMGLYSFFILVAIAVILWKLKGYNKREKKLREALRSQDLIDKDATFVPQRHTRRKKEERRRRPNADCREGRSITRRSTKKMQERERRAKELEATLGHTSTEEDSNSATCSDDNSTES